MNTRRGTQVFKAFPTYRELKKALPEYLADYYYGYPDYIPVIRERRGQWGQWFEHWAWDWEKKRAKIIKQGWL